jgi:hypothetical protein
MTDTQKNILKNPSSYIGIAAKKAKKISADWKKRLAL